MQSQLLKTRSKRCNPALFPANEPHPLQKKPEILAKEPYFPQKKLCFSAQELYIYDAACCRNCRGHILSANCQQASFCFRKAVYFCNRPLDSTNEPCISEKEPCISEKEPCISEKEPCISEKEPCISEKEPHISAKERCISAKESFYVSVKEPL